MKKNSLILSVLTVVLCASLIAGSSFALFTSESKVNVAVTAGKVDVVATVENLTLGTELENGNLPETSATAEGNEITLDKIVPGDYVTFDIRIHNNSNVTVQYRTSISKVSDSGLWSGLVVTFDDVKYEGKNAITSEWGTMAVGSDDIIVSVKIQLPVEAGNEYQKTSCKLAYTVEAVQGNADLPILIDANTVADPDWYDAEATELLVEDGADFLAFMETAYTWGVANKPNVPDFSGKTIKLNVDIEFVDGYLWTPISPYDSMYLGNGGFKGTFDGQGHTIYNLNVTNNNKTGRGYRIGLFGEVGDGAVFKNLTLDGVNTYAGNSSAGALCALTSGNVTFENITVRNSTVRQGRFAGGIVGDIRGTDKTTVTFRNCTVENSAIFNIHDNYCGALYGAKNTDVNIATENCTVTNVVKHFFKDASGAQDWDTFHYISLADALTAYASEPAGFGGN